MSNMGCHLMATYWYWCFGINAFVRSHTNVKILNIFMFDTINFRCVTIRFNYDTMRITIHGWWYDTRTMWAHLEWYGKIQWLDINKVTFLFFSKNRPRGKEKASFCALVELHFYCLLYFCRCFVLYQLTHR